MDDQNVNQNASYVDPVRQEPTIRPPVSTGAPDTPNRKKGKGFPKWIIALIGVILILAIGGFFIANSLGNASEEASPSPTTAGLSTFPTPEVIPTSEPSPTPAEIDKSEVKIEVLNGTGTPGEASFLKGKLEGLGFGNIEAANADSQDETTTTVTYSRDLPQILTDEITNELEDLYGSVEVKTGTVSGGFDVRILTGPRIGATSTPKATASPSPSASPTATPNN